VDGVSGTHVQYPLLPKDLDGIHLGTLEGLENSAQEFCNKPGIRNYISHQTEVFRRDFGLDSITKDGFHSLKTVKYVFVLMGDVLHRIWPKDVGILFE
jgi:hypothetical protein